MLSFSPLLLAAAVALPALLPATAADVAAPFADIPNVTIAPYAVAGRNAAAVRRAIDAVRPTDPNDGQRVDGLSHYEFRWRWHRDGQGKCTAAPEDVTFSATVTVPRLAENDPPSRLRDQFDRYLQSLLGHEEGHIRYAWNHRGDIATAINAATCDTAKAAAMAALKAIAAHDIEYDKATRHGRTTGVPFG
jgi:predicted secreted Zn-dependent protease